MDSPDEDTLTPLQRARISQFEELVPPPGATLFLGDSITESGHWSEWFPELVTVNRGVGGDTVAGVRQRLDSAVNCPATVSLMIGTNDISRNAEIDSLATEFGALLDGLRERAPLARLVVTGVLPRTSEFRSAIADLNTRYADEVDARNGTWIDVGECLSDEAGVLADRFTYDGLHLLGAGYRVWAEALAAHL